MWGETDQATRRIFASSAPYDRPASYRGPSEPQPRQSLHYRKITGFVGRTALCMIARPRSDRQLGRSFTRSQCFSIEVLNDSLGDGSRGSEGACFASEIRNAQLSLIR